MRLEDLQLEESPTNTLAKLVCAQLRAALDTAKLNPLNGFVDLLKNAILKDGQMQIPPADKCPAVFITWNPETDIEEDQYGTVDRQMVTFDFYVLYYTGVASATFQNLRDDHIRWNKKYLSLQNNANPLGITIVLPAWCVWWQGPYPVVHDLPGIPLGAKLHEFGKDYSVSKFSKQAWVKQF